VGGQRPILAPLASKPGGAFALPALQLVPSLGNVRVKEEHGKPLPNENSDLLLAHC